METLFDLEPAEPDKPSRQSGPERVTSKGIAPGDIVEVEKRGRRFHAVVETIQQRETGFHDLALRPINRHVTYRTATIGEIVAVYRKAS